MLNENIRAVQAAMKKQGLDLYYLNTSDYNLSEYVSGYFKTIEYFSGFTGSLASLLISSDEAFIFVDGRYHSQADRQCLPNGVKVVKLGTAGAMDVVDFVAYRFPKAVLGLDGKRTSVRFADRLHKKGITLKDIDIYSALIKDRPALTKSRVYGLDECHTGLSRQRKLKLIAHCLGGRCHIVDDLTSIAYILNLRGSDIPHTPVFASYLIFLDGDTYLFCDLERFDAKLLDDLYADGVIIRPYDSYYDLLEKIRDRKIIIDRGKVNYATFTRIEGRGNTIYDMRSIIEDMKAIKNPIEQRNMIDAHIYDGVSIVRFLKWLDGIDKRTISEYDAARKIDQLRLSYRAKDLSFTSIVAYNVNAALMHYAPKADDCAKLDNRGILLFDTGGQYDEGTTDVTRTVALGPVDDNIRRYYTLILKSVFELSELRFPEGLCGDQVDVLARKQLWQEGLDYRCGTGHGVGYALSVHEAPPNVRYMKTENGSERVPFKPGMIFSDEPGIYLEGRFGIRLENLLLCEKAEKTEYGQFLKFTTLTLAPFDLDLIDPNLLDRKTIDTLNEYHQRVYDTLAPYLNDEEKSFLKKLTRKL